MKQLTLLLLLTASMAFSTNRDYCDGWDDGYKAGYCYDVEQEQPNPFCLEPIPPLCPLPGLNESTYEHGYNRGFLHGIEDQRIMK